MTHLILDLLRRFWGLIAFLILVGSLPNKEVLEDRSLVLPFCFLAPFLLAAMGVFALLDFWQKPVVLLLPLSRFRISLSFWITGVFIIPLIGIVIALPHFLWEQWYFPSRGTGSGISCARYLYSLLTYVSLSGLVLLFLSLGPNPRWSESIPFWLLPFLMLFWTGGIPFLIWVPCHFTPLHRMPIPMSMAAALPHILSWGAAGIALPLIRYLQFGSGPIKRRHWKRKAPQSRSLVAQPPVVFQKHDHPLVSFSSGVAIIVFWVACIAQVAIWAWTEVGIFRETGKWGWPGLHCAWESPSEPIFLCAVLTVPLLLVSLWNNISELRVLRMLPISSCRFFLCVTAKGVAAVFLPFAAFVPSFVLLGVLQGDVNAVFQFFVAVYLGAVAWLMLLTAVLLAQSALVLLAFIPVAFGLVFSYLSRSIPLINGLHLLLFLISCALLYFTLTRSSQVYRLKAEIKE